MAKQLAIAAFDHREAVFHQIEHHIAKRRGLPWIFSDSFDSENDLGNFTVVGIVHSTVDGAQHVFQTATLLCSHTGVFRNGQTVQPPPQARQGLDTIESMGIDWYDGSNRLTWCEFRQRDQMQTAAFSEHGDMEAFSRGLPELYIKIAENNRTGLR